MTVAPTSESPKLAAARAGLAAARAPRAVAPRAELRALRRAYLDLLKLCLCDLGGSTTVSVGRTEDGRVMSREIEDDGLRLRSAGMDWPLQGLSMVGLTRLDDLQACVESIVRDGVEGDLIEAGTWRGGAAILMRATLDAFGVEDRTVTVADSFRGFPPASDRGGDGGDLAVFDFLAVPLEEVRANFGRFGLERGVEFVPGFFADTLPTLAGRRWSMVRLDGDTYEATRLALHTLYAGLSVGGQLIVDDYGALDECREAVDEFRREQGIAEPLEQVDWTCVRWRREHGAPAGAPVAASAAPSARAELGSPSRPPRTAVPSVRELELTRELEQLRAQLAAARERGADRGDGLRSAAQTWLRSRVGRR